MTLHRKGEIPPPPPRPQHKTLLSTGTFFSLIMALYCCYQVSLGPGWPKYINSTVFSALPPSFLAKHQKGCVHIKKVGGVSPLLCVVEDCMLSKLVYPSYGIHQCYSFSGFYFLQNIFGPSPPVSFGKNSNQ